MEEKTAQFYSESQIEQKYEFGADADISDAFNVNQWDVCNTMI